MPLIFSKNKETHEKSAEDFKENTGEEAHTVYCDNLTKDALVFTPNLSLCNSKNSSEFPNEVDIFEEVKHSVMETGALRQPSETLESHASNGTMKENYLTVSGTIKRGKKKGQNVEVVLNMSREELEILEVDRTFKYCCQCSMKKGVGFHILLWTVFCFPFSVITSGIYSFYMGTITWYNVFKLFSENQTVLYRLSIPPLLMIFYPFLIISVSLGLGMYSGVKQLSCCWDSWKKEFSDYEKGFFGWLCNSLDVPECSPYEVVILSSVQKP